MVLALVRWSSVFYHVLVFAMKCEYLLLNPWNSRWCWHWLGGAPGNCNAQFCLAIRIQFILFEDIKIEIESHLPSKHRITESHSTQMHY